MAAGRSVVLYENGGGRPSPTAPAICCPTLRRVFDLLEHDARVVAAKAERVRERHLDVALLGRVERVVEVAGRIRRLEVDRRRDFAVLDGQDGAPLDYDACLTALGGEADGEAE